MSDKVRGKVWLSKWKLCRENFVVKTLSEFQTNSRFTLQSIFIYENISGHRQPKNAMYKYKNSGYRADALYWSWCFVLKLIFHAEIDISCSTISLRRSGRYGGDLIEEKWISYLAILLRRKWISCLAICLRRTDRDVTIGDYIDDLFEESGHGAWKSCLRLAWGEVDIVFSNSLRRRGYYDWRFCWRFFWGEWTWCLAIFSAISLEEVDITIGDSVEKRMSCSMISLRRNGYYDWRFCWRLFWGE
jgi:hypothetical protein